MVFGAVAVLLELVSDWCLAFNHLLSQDLGCVGGLVVKLLENGGLLPLV